MVLPTAACAGLTPPPTKIPVFEFVLETVLPPSIPSITYPPVHREGKSRYTVLGTCAHIIAAVVAPEVK